MLRPDKTGSNVSNKSICILFLSTFGFISKIKQFNLPKIDNLLYASVVRNSLGSIPLTHSSLLSGSLGIILVSLIKVDIGILSI
jgi:hypothetical protein